MRAARLKNIAPIKDRIYRSIEFDLNGGCWLWSGATNSDIGYGQISFNRKVARVHRLSWEIHYGPIPEGLHVCHRCDVPVCVNPDHLFLGTHTDNMRDKVRKGRDWCKQGEKCPTSKLKDSDIPVILERIRRGHTDSQIREDYGVTSYAIYAVRNGRTWNHITGFIKQT